MQIQAHHTPAENPSAFPSGLMIKAKLLTLTDGVLAHSQWASAIFHLELSCFPE